MIAPAINDQGSTLDLDLVGTDIMGIKWQHGSTYMAQDLILMLEPQWLVEEGRFEVLHAFTVNLMFRYQAHYFSHVCSSSWPLGT